MTTHLGQLTPNNAASLAVSLADALVFLNRQADAAALLECHLGLAGSDYRRPEALRPQMTRHLTGLTPSNTANLLRVLADALRAVSRQSDAATLLETHLGLAAGSYRRPEALQPHLTKRLADLTPGDAVNLLRTLAESLRLLGRGTDGAALLEGYLGLKAADYRQLEALDTVLIERLANVTPTDAANLLVSLADTLRLLGRGGDGAALLEGYLGLTPDDYRQPEALGRA